MFDFFEQPYTLIGGAVLVLFGVFTVRSVLPEKRRFWQWLLPLALVGAAFGLDALVQTDTEQINATIKAGVRGIEAEDLDAIGRVISESYSDSLHGTKQRLLFYCRQSLSQSQGQGCQADGFVGCQRDRNGVYAVDIRQKQLCR